VGDEVQTLVARITAGLDAYDTERITAGTSERNTRSVIRKRYTGRYTKQEGVPKCMVGFRVEPELLARVDAAAAARGQTRSAEILDRLEAAYAVDALDAATLERLDRLAAAEGCSRVDMIREALAAAAAAVNGAGAAA
jgi:predicted transcriptional regulator